MPVAVGLEPRIAQPLVGIEQSTEQRPPFFPRRSDSEVAVLCPEHTVRGVDRVMIPGWRRHAAAIQVAHRLEPHRPHHRLQQRRVDDLTASGTLPRLERRHDAERTVEPGEQIGNRNANAHWLTSLETGYAHQPGYTLDDLIEPRAVGEGTIGAEPGDRAVDDPWIACRHRGVADAKDVHHAGPKVLHHDVGRLGQPAEDRLSFRPLDVESEGAFVAIRGEKEGTDA